MDLIPLQISDEQALRRLRPGWWGWLRREKVLRLELVFLPHYLFVFAAQTGDSSIELLCEGVTGFCSLIKAKQLSQQTPAYSYEVLNNVLSSQQARKVACEEFSHLALRYGISSTQRTPKDFAPIATTREIAFPYWVLHFSRAGRYDFRALDAISGERVNLRIRRALLQAFIGQAATQS